MSFSATINTIGSPLSDDHAELVVSKLMQGRVVPFLGAGVNLCDRPPGFTWTSSDYSFAPSGGELAAELAEKFKYIKKGSICTAPTDQCLRPRPELDLARISQFGDFREGPGGLSEVLRELFTRKYPPTSFHEFLSSLPTVEPEKSRPENRNLLIVTTNYDDMMERSLEEFGPVDVVFFDPEANPPRFWHREPDGTTKKIDNPKDHEYTFFEKQPVVLKIHGTIDRSEGGHEGFVITEDDYIEYLAGEPLENMLPEDILAKLRRNHLLFLGYSLRDWNLRVFLRRLKRPGQAYKAWAVMPHVDLLEKEFWMRQDVEIIQVMLKPYLDSLNSEVAAKSITFAAQERHWRGWRLMPDAVAEWSPYKGLLPYDENDAAYFFGRDRERRQISAALRASRLTVLYGDSGAGKSSVLAAGVANDLRDDTEYELVLFRTWRDDPMLGLRDAIVERLSRRPGFQPNEDSKNPVELLRAWTDSTHRTLLLVLDQFEEYFYYHPADDREGTLAGELPRLLNQPDLPVNILLSMRGDSLSVLDRFKGTIPAIFENLVRIDHLTQKAAKDAVTKPLARFKEDLRIGKIKNNGNVRPVQIDDTVAAKVVDEILAVQGGERERVEAPYLQLVMTRWWQREAEDGSEKLDLATLHGEKLGGVKKVVEGLLTETLKGLNPDEEQTLALVFDKMVTGTGRKQQQTISDLISDAEIEKRVQRAALVNLLERLVKARVLTSVPPPRGSQPDERCYEFGHDVLAKAAFDWTKDFQQKQELAEAKQREEEAHRLAQAERERAAAQAKLAEAEKRRAEEQARLAQAERERAAAQAQLAEVETNRAAEQERLAQAERQRAEQQAEQAKRFQRVSVVLGLVLLLAVGAILFGLWQRKNAQKALTQAQRNEAIARLRELIANSIVSREADPEMSLLVAAQAIAVSRSLSNLAFSEAEDQLHRAVLASHVQLTLFGDTYYVFSVAWSPDGKRLATASADGTAKVWDAASGNELLTLRGHKALVSSVAWSPDGKRLATASLDRTAKVWDAATGKELLTLRGHKAIVSSVAWSPDSKLLATGSWDHTAKVWDAVSGQELRTLHNHDRNVDGVAWSPDGKRLATGAEDSTAKVWDISGGKELLTLRGHTDSVISLAWGPDGKRLATGSSDHTARIWNADTGQELMVLRGHYSQVGSVAWSPDGTRLATGSVDRTAKVWNLATEHELLTLSGHNGHVYSVAWSPDGKRLATGSEDHTAKVWDAASGRESLTLRGHNGEVRSVAWSPDGKRLATGSADQTVKVWDAASGQELLTLRGHTAAVYSVSWSPDSKWLAAGSEDQTAKVWDAASGLESLTLRGHGDVLWSVGWSPDGKRLATASADGTARVWDGASGQELLTLGSSVPQNNVAWSPDGKRLATASADGTADVWDAATGQELLTLRGHISSVFSLAWSPDSKRLATGSSDYTTRLWEAAGEQELLTLRGHNGEVSSVAWSPDGKRLATASWDGKVQVYVMDIRDLMELARQRVTAHPSDEGCKKYLHVDKCPPFPQLP
jgi:WD40 repeat protein